MTTATPTKTYFVDGMTCDHCVGSVTGALQSLPGVETVNVDLSSGAVTVASTSELDPAVVRAAISDAGYELRA